MRSDRGLLLLTWWDVPGSPTNTNVQGKRLLSMVMLSVSWQKCHAERAAMCGAGQGRNELQTTAANKRIRPVPRFLALPSYIPLIWTPVPLGERQC